MSKRKPFQLDHHQHLSKRRNPERSNNTQDPTAKKHTLDSDEEDFVDENNLLEDNDIEGQEDGSKIRQDGEQRMTAFNMREELEEGHFDRDGHFIWNNEKEVRDNWLDNIDWQVIKHNTESSNKYDIDESGEGLAAESDSDEEEDKTAFSEIDTYKKIIAYMKPKESINKTLKRLGGELSKLSSVERLKRKKAGTLNESEDVTKLTELANQILTRLGNMDIYQETYELIQQKIDNNEKKNKKLVPELDMYADDFDTKEKEQLKDESSSSATSSSSAIPQNVELKWIFKWSNTDEKIRGPFSNSQMIKWQKESYFKPGVMVKKVGETSNFYSLGRIDFELYE